jgi:hypothetical protein
MIYFYGDSHCQYSFKGLNLEHKNFYQASVTMHRIGRDNTIINFNNNKLNSINVLCYGEVDCRCHIGRQIDLGKKEDEIIQNLVSNYLKQLKALKRLK